MAKVPVIEGIASAIQTALGTISITAGDLVDVSSVVRPNQWGDNYAPADKMIVLVQGDTVPRDPVPLGRVGWNTTFVAVYLIAQDKLDPVAIDTIRNRASAAILDCLLSATNRQWSGLAPGGTDPGETVPFSTIEHDGYDGVTVAVQVLWQHVIGNACSVA